jgi:phosphate transporter
MSFRNVMLQKLTYDITAAIMMEEPNTGRRYLQVKHFITRGVPASIMAYGVIVTVGYGLMLAAGM